MSNLKLITTENFGDLSCNFYRNMNDDILLTREQIGSALEYSNPREAIKNIHRKHKARLDELSMRIKLGGCQTEPSSKSEEQECVYYTQRGIMEICRWSRQPKANQFMDWCWNIIEKYRNNEINQSIDITPLMESISSLASTMTKLQEEMTKLKDSSKNKPLPANKYSRWKTNVFNKIKLIQSYVNDNSDQELSLPQTMKLIFNELQDTYDIDLSEYTEMYQCEYSLDFDSKVQTLDVINHYRDIRDMFTLTLDSILERLHLQENTDLKSGKNIFDVLAAQLESK